MAIDVFTSPVDLPGRLASSFAKHFGGSPRLFSAPGRVNIIGDHTDYNDGFVLPMAIDRRTWVAIAPRADRRLRIKSLAVNRETEVNLDEPSTLKDHRWANYAAGVAWTLSERGVRLVGADLMIDSDVPIGAGLSSSAALEIAAGKALTAIAEAELDPVQLALAAQEAEQRFAGVKVGIMDQLTVVLGRREQALLIDCRLLDAKAIPLGKLDAAMVVCDTRVRHDLASSAYNERRKECAGGVELLHRRLPGIRSLRDVTVEDFRTYESELPELIRRRCRHVVTENERTLKAAEALLGGEREVLGALMKQSHQSLRDDFEVSCRALDVMVDIANQADGVWGARMTGGGFGGCTINVVETEAVDAFRAFVTSEYRAATNLEADVYLAKASDGARELVVT